MGAMASQITSVSIAYPTAFSGADKKTTSKLCVTDFCGGNSPETYEFPAQMASNAEDVFIWWRHHELSGVWHLLYAKGNVSGNGISIIVPWIASL